LHGRGVPFLPRGRLYDDPPIYYWNERIDPKVEKGFNSFWDWFRDMVEHYEKIQQFGIKHPPFDESVRADIRHIQEAFVEHSPLSFNECEYMFRCDTNPEQEIARWSHAADIYAEFAASELSAERRRDIYLCLGACLTSRPDAVWHVFKPEVLSRAEAEQIVNRFFGKSANTTAVRPRE
jgi:hypothetical protein